MKPASTKQSSSVPNKDKYKDKYKYKDKDKDKDRDKDRDKDNTVTKIVIKIRTTGLTGTPLLATRPACGMKRVM